MEDIFEPLESLNRLEPPQRVWNKIEQRLATQIPEKTVAVFVAASMIFALLAIGAASQKTDNSYQTVDSVISYDHE
ncbi:MAG: hypothetical protein NWR73_00115 [Flavobacteriales bacterium]|nr:hypothetical protein [Flavobacteriales bacterium]